MSSQALLLLNFLFCCYDAISLSLSFSLLAGKPNSNFIPVVTLNTFSPFMFWSWFSPAPVSAMLNSRQPSASSSQHRTFYISIKIKLALYNLQNLRRKYIFMVVSFVFLSFLLPSSSRKSPLFLDTVFASCKRDTKRQQRRKIFVEIKGLEGFKECQLEMMRGAVKHR